MDDRGNWLGSYNMIIGENAYKQLCSMSGEDQEIVMKAVRSFYTTAAKKLLEYLPFGNSFLMSCKFLAKHSEERTVGKVDVDWLEACRS